MFLELSTYFHILLYLGRDQEIALHEAWEDNR